MPGWPSYIALGRRWTETRLQGSEEGLHRSKLDSLCRSMKPAKLQSLIDVSETYGQRVPYARLGVLAWL